MHTSIEKRTIFICLFLSFLTTIFYSCEKDNFTVEVNNEQNKNNEQLFFNLNNSPNNVNLRTDQTFLIHEELFDVYDQIVDENTKGNFASTIVENFGYPLWNRSVIQTDNNNSVVLIPIVNGEYVTSIIAGYKSSSGEYILNYFSRNDLTFTNSLNISENEAIRNDNEFIQRGTWFLKLDKSIYQRENPILSDHICSKKASSTPPTSTLPSDPCNLVQKEICWHLDSNTTWIGGYNFTPVHLDHDLDGIPNYEDQDWLDLIYIYGADLNQEIFTQRIRDIWEKNFEYDYGDYDTFWDDLADQYDPWADYNSNFDLFDLMGDLWNYFFGGEDPYDYQDDYYNDDYPDYPCPDGGGIVDEDEIETRGEISCQFYYVYDCLDNPWWENINEAFQGNGELARLRLFQHWQIKHEMNTDFAYLESIINESDCSPFSFDYEFCVDEVLIAARQKRMESLVYYNTQLNLDFELMEIITRNCYIDETESYESCAIAAINYIEWATINHDISVEEIVNGLLDFNPHYDIYQEQEDETRIEILSYFVPLNDIENDFTKLVETPWRLGHEYDPVNNIRPQDLQSGFGGNTGLLTQAFLVNENANEFLRFSSNEELESLAGSVIKNRLLHNEESLIFGNLYYDRFIAGTGGDYFNADFCEYLINTENTYRAVKKFGKLLNIYLKENNGDFSSINFSEMELDFTVDNRPLYSNYFNGMKILLNDTEKVIVYDLDEYSFDNVTKQWKGKFAFQVFDNFGLDDDDLLKFQETFPVGHYFAAWWLLQHTRGYKPFRSDLRFVFEITGNLDD